MELTEKEFIQQYVLNRARGYTGGSGKCPIDDFIEEAREAFRKIDMRV